MGLKDAWKPLFVLSGLSCQVRHWKVLLVGLLVKAAHRDWREQRPLGYADRESKSDIKSTPVESSDYSSSSCHLTEICLTDHKKKEMGQLPTHLSPRYHKMVSFVWGP